MKHLKEFETETAFENAKSSLESPCIALTEDDTEIHIVYNKEPLPLEFVDLGLSSGTQWASRNLGATKPEEYGDYYQWGSITPNTNTVCDWAHAPFNNGLSSYDSSFEDNISTLFDGNDVYGYVLKSKDDAAYQATNGKARIPTKAQCEELLENTTQEWITVSDMKGLYGTRFTSKNNGNSIFIPAAGERGSNTINPGSDATGSYTSLWTSSLDLDNTDSAFRLILDDPNCEVWTYNERYHGFTVRPVLNRYDIKFVDLGLPDGLKWGSCNLGAENEYEYGEYYQWGSKTPNTNTVCDWAHAPFNNGSSSFDLTYFNDYNYVWLDGDVLKPIYDAAVVAGKGRMPTPTEFQTLKDNTYWQWVDSDTDVVVKVINNDGTITAQTVKYPAGYFVYKVKDDTHKGQMNTADISALYDYNYHPAVEASPEKEADIHIFLPANGYIYGTGLFNRDLRGHYWSSSFDTEDPEFSHNLHFNRDNIYPQSAYHGCHGLGIRSVSEN